MYRIDMLDLVRPYPNKCYLPFILYPPGMHRNTEGEAFLSRLKALDKDGEDFVLYLGVPFCRTRCKSCPYFVSLLPESDKHNREDAYVDALIRDLEHWATFRRWKTGQVRNIYIGGGTGSVLKTANLKRLVDKIFSLFRVADDYEFTLEGNARDFDEQKIDFLVGSRINRLSLGVQSFQPEILATIGSPHAANDSIRVIRAFQSRGFKNIQLDLMYNMPGQTLDVWQRDLKMLSELDVPHFTIYLYRIHKQTPQDKLIAKGKVAPPRHAETPMVKAMYAEAKDIAEAMGFKMYMVDHISAHGSSTPQNDVNETGAIKSVFGQLAKSIPVNSLKSMTGHALAAANAIECVALSLELYHQRLHPTVNYRRADPACDLDYVPNIGKNSRILSAMKLTSGFSGIHSVLVMRAEQQ